MATRFITKNHKHIPLSKKGASALTSKNVKFKTPLKIGSNSELLKQKSKDIPEQKVTDLFTFDKLSDDAKEKARDWYKEGIADDDFFAQDQGIIFDDSEKLDPEEMGLNNPISPSGYDVGGSRGGDYIQFDDLEVKDDKKFQKYLGLSDKVLEKVNFEITTLSDETNTRLQFFDSSGGNSEGTGGEIDLSPDIAWIDEHYEFDANQPIGERMFQLNDIPTVAEGHEVLRAFDKFADLMDDSLKHLKNNYESQFEDESVDENIRINDYTFDKDGKRVVA